jgi:hypothetical protein
MKQWGTSRYFEHRTEALNYNGPPVDLKATVARLTVLWAEIEAAWRRLR